MSADDVLADAWEQGYLFAHYQDRGIKVSGRAEVPWHLVDAIRMWNPHRDNRPKVWCRECGAFHVRLDGACGG